MKHVAIILFLSLLLGCKASKMNVDEEFEKALTFMDEENYEEAEKIFLNLNKIEPELVGIKMNLAGIEEIKGDTLKAIAYLKSALEIEPNHPVIARRLAEVTGENKYKNLETELKNKVIEVSSKQFYNAYKQGLDVVNDEYVKFDIKLTGKIVAISKGDGTIYLEGGPQGIKESVACYRAESIIDVAKIGETITLIGNSLGQGLDSMDPIILIKE